MVNRGKGKSMEKVTITIRKDQRVWLEHHPSVNISALVQEAIDERAMVELIRQGLK